MSLAFVSQSIREFINANYSETTFALKNNFFDMPEKDPWIRINILPGASEIIGKCTRISGLIDVQVFEYKESGTEQTEKIVDIISDLLKNKRINGILMGKPDTFDSGLVKEWTLMTVSFTYEYDTF